MELTPEQVLIVGIVASVLSVVVRLLAARFGIELGKGIMTVIVAVVSLVLSMVFYPPSLPIYVDPLQYLGEWLLLLSSYVGLATVIYNLIIDKVATRLNLTVERFLKKS